MKNNHVLVSSHPPCFYLKWLHTITQFHFRLEPTFISLYFARKKGNRFRDLLKGLNIHGYIIYKAKTELDSYQIRYERLYSLTQPESLASFLVMSLSCLQENFSRLLEGQSSLKALFLILASFCHTFCKMIPHSFHNVKVCGSTDC